MRCSLLLLCLASFASLARGQEQENKMMDRIMRPKMSLSNPAQNRKFEAVEGTSVDKKFVAKSFYSGNEKSTKSFSGLRSFFSKVFGTRKYPRAKAAADAKPNSEMVFAKSKFPAGKSSLIRTSSLAGKTTPVRDYADNRPFLAQGTRQEQLSQQNHPLTIDEVRELLNKNK